MKPMKPIIPSSVAAVVLTLAATCSSNAQPAKITVDAAHPAHPIPQTLWGIFFEDINLSADGGIYPELVRNRSFEDSDQLEKWTFTRQGGDTEAAVSVADSQGKPVPLNCFNRKSLRIKSGGAFTLVNEGYHGMNFIQGDAYTLKFAARGEDFTGRLTAKLLGQDGKILASGGISGFGKDWAYHTLELNPGASDPKGKLQIDGDGRGVLFLDMVSLMPKKTWKDHGLRVDLAESLDALKPKFFRFPGGCWVEGDDFAHMYHWKTTVGHIDTRTPLWNIWTYHATQGLGYHEYLQLSEDLGAEPLFCINIGMSHKETVPMDRMAQWVQDALDAIEYANGPVDSVWGSMRAAAGHPAPFNLKYLEIGNENGGYPGYVERWKLFHRAIKAKYPAIKLIANGWNDYGDCPADIVDDHYYNSPEWFMRESTMYDKKDRNGPKVFVGEYAVTQNCGLGNLRGAIGEAAYMTGLERNSDVVEMASYAPLLANVNHRGWSPDLINFDSASWYGLPGYYVQQLFAQNRGDRYLPTRVESPDVELPPGNGMIGVGTWNTAAEYKDIRVTAPDGKVMLQSDFSHGTQGWKLLGHRADWKVVDGALRQSAPGEANRALAGDKSWTDYTLSLKARKISGSEGFLILFHIGDENARTWWNIGGWGNSKSGIESGGGIDLKPGHIETGRWYDIKLTVVGNTAQCWLDGRLIHDVNVGKAAGIRSLYASAATDSTTKDLIVKVVNADTKSHETVIHLPGANMTGKCKVTVLTSKHATDENSLAEPAKVVPRTEAASFDGQNLKHDFPANSFTVLRVHTH
jgi:alpha-L-arabinofuranosidase